jgi:hypothetical protein
MAEARVNALNIPRPPVFAVAEERLHRKRMLAAAFRLFFAFRIRRRSGGVYHRTRSGTDCRQPGAALRRTLLYRHDEASDLDLRGRPSHPSENPARAWSSETNQKTYKLLWRRRCRWGLNLVRINVCKIGASESV